MNDRDDLDAALNVAIERFYHDHLVAKQRRRLKRLEGELLFLGASRAGKSSEAGGLGVISMCPDCGSYFYTRCTKCPPAGMVKCPNDHPKNEPCTLCRKTPGFVEELK